MDKHNKEYIFSIIFVIMFAVSILYGVLGELFLPEETREDDGYCAEYMDGWYQVIEDGTTLGVDMPGRTGVVINNEVTIENTLPSDIKDDAYIIFRTTKQDYSVYIGGELRAEYSTKATRVWGKTSPAYYFFVKIDSKDSGKTIRADVTGVEKYVGTFHAIYYANYSGFWRKIIHEQGTNFLIAIIMLILSVLTFCFAFVLQLIYKKKQKLLILSVGVLIVAFWMFGNSDFRQLLFPNISVISDITFLMVTLMPFAFSAYMNQLQNRRYAPFYLVSEFLALFDMLLCVILYVTGVKDFVETFTIMALVLFYTIVVIIATLVIDVIRGFAKEYWMTLAAIGLAAITAFVQIMNYLNKDTVFDVSIGAVGLLLMLLVAIFDTVSDISSMENERQSALVASETKSQFLANMSHEIRTPINAILGMNEMILNESTEENIRSYAHDVDNSGKILLSLINGILDFSKIESGKMEIVDNEYRLEDLLDRVVVMAKERISDKDIELKVNVAPDIPAVLYGDEAKVQQIITNILTNAIKYTDVGEVALDITCEAEGDINNFNIVVSDTGRGIKAEDIDKLFTSFMRVDEKRNSAIEGTGLGLAITKNLVTLMNGTIGVSSEYGKGSEFTICIPQKSCGSEKIGKYDINRIWEADKTEDERMLYAAGIKVLVADDIDMNLKVFTAFLKDTGINVDAVGSGEGALIAWCKQKYDLVFLDHMMPGMDGIQCIRELFKNNRLNPDTPVIMLTANAIVGMKEQYMQEGFADYMTKPFKKSDLHEMIMKHISTDKWKFVTKKEIKKLKESEAIAKAMQEELSLRDRLKSQEDVDYEIGMSYCCNDEAFYTDMIEEYIAGDRLTLMNRYYEDGDWENYRILVHSLKSTSLTIGAHNLSEHAKALEKATKEQDIEYINSNHAFVMEEYDRILTILRNLFS